MSKETKAMTRADKTIVAEMMATFEAYKQTNDARLNEIEAKGSADTLLEDQLARLDKRIDSLSLKAAAPETGGSAVPTGSQDTAWSRYMRRGDESGLGQMDTKAFRASTDDQGGYVAPPELDRMIEARLLNSSPMRQIATVRQSSAGVYRKPVSLGIGARWASETTSRTETTTSGLSLLEFPAGDLYCMPAASQTILDDAYVDVDQWLADEVDAVFSLQESITFVTGDGSSKPKGFLDYSIVAESAMTWGKIGSIAGDFSAANPGDQLIDLIHTPQAQFRSNGRFVMNRRTAATVRKLKDADGRYLWVPGAGGEAATILGYPVTEMENMPDIADGEAAIAFGDFRRGYLIVDRQGVQVLRDPYTAKPYVLFYTTKRVGGGVQNFDAIKVLKF
ncbi:MAG: phage major capsid protein [Pseudomonadota bacterium]